MQPATHHASPGSSSEPAFTLHYRGVTLTVASDDPRLAFIDLLFFGRPLPPPVPLAEPPPPKPAPEPEPEPAPVEVPRPWLAYWKSLPEGPRRMLVALCHDALTTAGLEARLGVGTGETRPMSILIATRAKGAGLASPVTGEGRGRAGRRHRVVEEARPIVLELERRWRKLAEAVEAAER